MRRDLLFIVLIAAVITAVFADVLFLGTSLAADDIPAYHFPMKKAVRDLAASGEFPYWNRLVDAGQPVAANPAYELFYPPQWLIFLPSFLIGFKLHILIHFFLAAFGMYALTRELGLGDAARFVAAIAHGIGGPLMSLGGILPFLFSMAWLPWTLYFALRSRRRHSDFALAAVCLAMQIIIGEPVVLLSTGALLLAGTIALRRPLPLIALLAAAAALSSVQLIPGLDHARDSVRSVPIEYSTVRFWSSSPARPLELFVPSQRFQGPTRPFLRSVYLGITLAVLALAGMLMRLKWWGWTLAIAAISYLLAIGDHTPLLQWLYDAGIFSSLRYPEKFLLPALFVVVLFGAYALDHLIKLRTPALVVLAITFVIALATGSIGGAVRALVLAAIIYVIRLPNAQLALVAFAVIDVLSISGRLLVRVPDSFFTEPPPLLAKLPPPRERIYHQLGGERTRRQRGLLLDPAIAQWLVRNEMVPCVPEQFGRGWALGDDFDRTDLLPALSLRAASEFAQRDNPAVWPRQFMAISGARYRIVARDPALAAAESGGDLARLIPADVVAEPIRAARYAFASRLVPCRDYADCARKMRNDEGEALVPPQFRGGLVAPGVVRSWNETPNTTTLDVVAQGDAFLTLAVSYHKYWSATIDGKPAPLLRANIAYQGLFVPRGPHRIRLEYRNPMIRAGAMVSALAVLVLAGLVRFRGRPDAHAVERPIDEHHGDQQEDRGEDRVRPVCLRLNRALHLDRSRHFAEEGRVLRACEAKRKSQKRYLLAIIEVCWPGSTEAIT